VEIKVEQAKVVYVAVLFYIKSISIIDIISNISVISKIQGFFSGNQGGTSKSCICGCIILYQKYINNRYNK
jgi:hypothetical protein